MSDLAHYLARERTSPTSHRVSKTPYFLANYATVSPLELATFIFHHLRSLALYSRLLRNYPAHLLHPRFMPTQLYIKIPHQIHYVTKGYELLIRPTLTFLTNTARNRSKGKDGGNKRFDVCLHRLIAEVVVLDCRKRHPSRVLCSYRMMVGRFGQGRF